MRKVSSFQDVQIVLNQLLNWQSLWDTKARDQKGLQIKNAGDATDLQDFVTLNQLRTQVPPQQVQQVVGGGSVVAAPFSDIKTILWTEALTPLTNDVIPPFVIAQPGFKYNPILFWLSLNTASANPTTINIRSNTTGASVSAGTTVFNANLTLAAGAFYAQTTTLIANVAGQFPFLPGTQITPTILAAGGGVAISIGLVCKVLSV